MNSFARVITLLRKEKGITQKQAARDLDISQALLSHYEKGLRECGLDFLVKPCDYYNVSSDYVLGRSANSHVPSYIRRTSTPSFAFLSRTFKSFPHI